MKYKILLIDDDKDDRDLLLETLKAAGISDLLIAGSAEEGWKILEKSEILPDLIILDLFMPHVDGLEMLIQLKADDKYRDIDVVIYSASTLSIHHNQALNLGARKFISKPMLKSEYPSVVESIMENIYADC